MKSKRKTNHERLLTLKLRVAKGEVGRKGFFIQIIEIKIINEKMNEFDYIKIMSSLSFKIHQSDKKVLIKKRYLKYKMTKY